MSFVLEEAAKNFDTQVTAFWSHIIQRDVEVRGRWGREGRRLFCPSGMLVHHGELSVSPTIMVAI